MVPRRSLPPTSAVDDATQRTTMALVAVLAFLLGFAACYLLVRIGAFSHG